jgi:hypothetical protein
MTGATNGAMFTKCQDCGALADTPCTIGGQTNIVLELAQIVTIEHRVYHLSRITDSLRARYWSRR